MGEVFISCTKEIEIRNKPKQVGIKDITGVDSYRIPRGYIGPVPEWVSNHWYFKAHCNDGSITLYGGNKPTNKQIDESESISKLIDSDKQKKAKAKAEYDSRKENIKKRLEKEAIEKSLTPEEKQEYIKNGLKDEKQKILDATE